MEEEEGHAAGSESFAKFLARGELGIVMRYVCEFFKIVSHVSCPELIKLLWHLIMVFKGLRVN